LPGIQLKQDCEGALVNNKKNRNSMGFVKQHVMICERNVPMKENRSILD